MTSELQYNRYRLIPVYGICLFIILYFIASRYYPGGSDIDASSKGFSWMHNYWCELMASRASNGEENTAKPIAITAMSILAASLVIFWYFAAGFFRARSVARYMVKITGILSGVVWIFFLTGRHDMVVNISGVLGVTAMTIFFIVLYKQKAWFLLYLGIFCLILCAANNYIYNTGHWMYYLAVIQKFSFGAFLLWFILVSTSKKVRSTKYEVRSS